MCKAFAGRADETRHSMLPSLRKPFACCNRAACDVSAPCGLPAVTKQHASAWQQIIHCRGLASVDFNCLQLSNSVSLRL